MSLGIFSFDLAAIIDSLSNFTDAPDPAFPPSANEPSLERTENVLQDASVADSLIDEVLMTAAISNAVTSVIVAAETAKKPAPLAPTTNSAGRAPVKLDEETRKEIERLIKSLQTSVIHNYKSTDIIDENAANERAANFPARKNREKPENKNESAEQEKKRELQRLELLREELKKLRMKKISDI